MKQISDKNSPEYKKYFEELMHTHDVRMKYIPDFQTRMKGVPSVADALGDKALAYIQYAPSPDVNQAYAWFKEALKTALKSVREGLDAQFINSGAAP